MRVTLQTFQCLFQALEVTKVTIQLRRVIYPSHNWMQCAGGVTGYRIQPEQSMDRPGWRESCTALSARCVTLKPRELSRLAGSPAAEYRTRLSGLRRPAWRCRGVPGPPASPWGLAVPLEGSGPARRARGPSGGISRALRDIGL